MSLELTAATAPLAEAAARIARLLPSRSPYGAAATVLLRADAAGLSLTASDAELSVWVEVSAMTHTDGVVAVPRRAFADTLAALDAPEVRLAVEGSRLAIRAAGARFALPVLDAASQSSPAELPPLAGTIAGTALGVAGPVAGAASRDGALPIFTGVRVRSDGDRLSLIATDRYRMGAASLSWQPATAPPTETTTAAAETTTTAAGTAAVEVAALVPAGLLAEICRQAGKAAAVRVHAGRDRFGLSWDGCTVVAASLAGPYPDRQLEGLLDIQPECVVELAADALAGAVQRAMPYAGPHGRVTLRTGDGVLQISGRDPLNGESEEAVKASVRDDHLTTHFQARLLLDALRPFTGQTVTLRMQAGLRATAVTAPGVDLTYLVVPMRDTTAP
ncbi:DNA polymerase III subunit beta [Actinomycetes bacterium KLBMP 9797]